LNTVAISFGCVDGVSIAKASAVCVRLNLPSLPSRKTSTICVSSRLAFSFEVGIGKALVLKVREAHDIFRREDFILKSAVETADHADDRR
jgi:hypothetical protein